MAKHKLRWAVCGKIRGVPTTYYFVSVSREGAMAQFRRKFPKVKITTVKRA